MATTSPFAFVTAIAMAKLRHGMSREQGLASFPLLATKVRCTAHAGNENSAITARTARMLPPFCEGGRLSPNGRRHPCRRELVARAPAGWKPALRARWQRAAAIRDHGLLVFRLERQVLDV